MANWLMKSHYKLTTKIAANNDAQPEHDTWDDKKMLLAGSGGKLTRFERFRNRFLRFIDRIMPYRKPIVAAYIILVTAGAVLLLNNIGRDVLPKVNSGQLQMRLRAPDGTRIERTEAMVVKTLGVLNELVGKKNIAITSAFIGQHPAQFSTSPIYLFMSGPHEAVLQLQLADDYNVNLDELKEKIRHRMKESIPNFRLSFEPIELTDKILSQGSPTPIEVRLVGRNKTLNEQYAYKVIDKLKAIPYLRDVQIGQPIKYPAIDVNIDRVRAAQLGVDVSDISRSLIASTSSSRYTDKNVWTDPSINQTYSVQVQIPENKMNSIDGIGQIPVLNNQQRPVLSDVATIVPDTTYGENDNLGALPVLTVTANINKTDLGTASHDVKAAIASLGKLPRGLTVETMGMTEVLSETLSSLQSGLIVAIVVIFLMLAANFQSFKVSLVILTTTPAVLLGSLIMLLITGSTLNLQSYMGIIMSVGVSIANSVLLITNAEHLRIHNSNALESAKEAAALRMRPILMTTVAMVAGMMPMAIGLGEGGDQATPLGRAVIGGLIASTFATLFVLPLVFAWFQKKTTVQSVSLDPEDKESKFYVGK
jgi:multidrug efflux pump subunit AcrB